MSSPATKVRSTLITLLTAEFGPDYFAVVPGKLDNSLGFDGAIIGVFPIRERPAGNDRLELQTTLQVQLFGNWNAQTDPHDIVDPAIVEGWAWRFGQMLANYKQTGDSTVWWFQLDSIDYQNDPTGSCTRFTATVTARGDNPTY
jgi:hypothetical protein